LAVGASAGLVAGEAFDVNNAGIGADFVDDVAKVLLPNRVAVVAEIDEDSTTPVDTRMEATGGTVFRRALSEVKDSIYEEDIAAMKADLARLRAEHAKAQAEHSISGWLQKPHGVVFKKWFNVLVVTIDLEVFAQRQKGNLQRVGCYSTSRIGFGRRTRQRRMDPDGRCEASSDAQL
jgi:hypothetical protein